MLDGQARRGEGEKKSLGEWRRKLLTLPPTQPSPTHPHLCPHTTKGPPAAKDAKPNTQLLLYEGVTYVSTERNSIQLRRTWNPSQEGKHAYGEGEEEKRSRALACLVFSGRFCFSSGLVWNSN